MKKRTSLLLISILFTSVFSFGQKDSLNAERLYANAIKEYYTHPNEAFQNLEDALVIINDSILYKNKENRFFLLRKALILDKLAYFYRRKKVDYIAVIESLQESIEIKDQIGETYTLGNTYREIGLVVSYYLKDYAKVKEYLDIALELSESTNNNELKADLLSDYGIYFLHIKDTVNTKNSILKSIHFSDSIDYKKGTALACDRYGRYLRTRGNYAGAIPFSKKSIALNTEINNRIGLEVGNWALGRNYRILNKPKKAIPYFKRAIQLSLEMNIEDILHTRYLSLSKAYSEIGDYKNALYYYKKYKNQKEKVVNIKSLKEFAVLDAKFTYDKQKTIDSIQFVNDKNKSIAIVKRNAEKRESWFVFGSTLFVLIIGFYFIRKRERAKILEKENKAIKKDLNDFTHLLIEKNKEKLTLIAELEKINLAVGENENLSKFQELVDSKILTTDDWTRFKSKFEAAYPNYLIGLKKLNLNFTSTEERFITLDKLKLSSDEIANMLGVSASTIRTTRYRLRKKINAPSEISITSFLEEL